MIKIILILFCILLLFYFLFGSKLNKRHNRYLIISFILVIALFLIFSGKLNFLPVALAPALLFFRRISGLLSILNMFSKSSFGMGFKPSFSTSYLRFKVDLKTKLVEIKIIKGSLMNRNFNSLSDKEKNILMKELENNDPKGFRIINMILSQSDFSNHSDQSNYELTVNNAYSILGLKEGASEQEIKKAYYGLMKKFHPDKDGNNYLSNLITEAKNKLLKQ